MATIVEELVGLVGLEIDDGSFKRGANALDNIKQQFEKVSQSAQRLAFAGAAVLGFTAVTNKMTAEQARMTEAVGISTNVLNALGGVAKEGGLELDVVVDLVEELNNKLGESKGVEEMTAVAEATSILGLEFENLRKLNPEEQFIRVLEAAKNLEDQQAAVSAADILLGGDANKFIGLLRTQDKSIQALIDDYSKYNLLAEQAQKDAVKFNKTFSATTKIFGTATKQLAALLGKAIEPILIAFNKWISENKELTQTLIDLFARTIPLVFGLATAAIAVMTAALIPMVAALWSAGVAALVAAAPFLILAASVGALVAGIALIVQDIMTFIEFGDKANTMAGTVAANFNQAGQAIRSGFGSALKWVNGVISSVLNNFNELVAMVTDNAVFNWAGGLFGGGETAIPDVPQSSAGGTASNFNSTINNSNQSDITINAPNSDGFQIQRILNEQNAESARSNSVGVLR